MVVKSCAAAEGMTQPELPASPSVSANSTGAALCGARSAETLWTSILARPPRRQSGWIRPEHKNTSLIPPLQTSWFKSTRSLHAHLPPLSTLGCYSFYLRTWRTLQRDPGVLAGSLALGRSWQGIYYKKKPKNQAAPWLPTLEARRESGRGRSLQSDMSCTKAHGQGSSSPSLALASWYFLCVQEKGCLERTTFPTWPRVDGTEMKPCISSLGQCELTAWYPKRNSATFFHYQDPGIARYELAIVDKVPFSCSYVCKLLCFVGEKKIIQLYKHTFSSNLSFSICISQHCLFCSLAACVNWVACSVSLTGH